MPTYGYRCQSCDQEFEVLQRMSDPPEAACPSCSGAGKRLFYPAGILFKGSGFYKTDSRGSEGAAVGPPADGTKTTDATPAPVTTPAPGAAAPSKPAAPAPTKSTPAPAPAAPAKPGTD